MKNCVCICGNQLAELLLKVATHCVTGAGTQRTTQPPHHVTRTTSWVPCYARGVNPALQVQHTSKGRRSYQQQQEEQEPGAERIAHLGEITQWWGGRSEWDPGADPGGRDHAVVGREISKRSRGGSRKRNANVTWQQNVVLLSCVCVCVCVCVCCVCVCVCACVYVCVCVCVHV